MQAMRPNHPTPPHQWNVHPSENQRQQALTPTKGPPPIMGASRVRSNKPLPLAPAKLVSKTSPGVTSHVAPQAAPVAAQRSQSPYDAPLPPFNPNCEAPITSWLWVVMADLINRRAVAEKINWAFASLIKTGQFANLNSAFVSFRFLKGGTTDLGKVTPKVLHLTVNEVSNGASHKYFSGGQLPVLSKNKSEGLRYARVDLVSRAIECKEGVNSVVQQIYNLIMQASAPQLSFPRFLGPNDTLPVLTFNPAETAPITSWLFRIVNCFSIRNLIIDEFNRAAERQVQGSQFSYFRLVYKYMDIKSFLEKMEFVTGYEGQALAGTNGLWTEKSLHLVVQVKDGKKERRIVHAFSSGQRECPSSQGKEKIKLCSTDVFSRDSEQAQATSLTKSRMLATVHQFIQEACGSIGQSGCRVTPEKSQQVEIPKFIANEDAPITTWLNRLQNSLQGRLELIEVLNAWGNEVIQRQGGGFTRIRFDFKYLQTHSNYHSAGTFTAKSLVMHLWEKRGKKEWELCCYYASGQAKKPRYNEAEIKPQLFIIDSESSRCECNDTEVKRKTMTRVHALLSEICSRSTAPLPDTNLAIPIFDNSPESPITKWLYQIAGNLRARKVIVCKLNSIIYQLLRTSNYYPLTRLRLSLDYTFSKLPGLNKKWSEKVLHLVVCYFEEEKKKKKEVEFGRYYSAHQSTIVGKTTSMSMYPVWTSIDAVGGRLEKLQSKRFRGVMGKLHQLLFDASNQYMAKLRN